MAFPSYVPTRTISLSGSYLDPGVAAAVTLTVTLRSSRDLTWTATGYKFAVLLTTLTSAPPDMWQASVPTTDATGWEDTATGLALSSPTHNYTATIEFVSPAGGQTVPAVTIGPFNLPLGDGSVVNLDSLFPQTTVTGTIPDIWGSISQKRAEIVGVTDASTLTTGTLNDARLPTASQGATISAGLAQKAPLPGTGINPLTGWIHADGYGTDPTGIADSGPAINAAIAAATTSGGTAGGAVVYIHPGTYLINTTINLSNIRLPFGVGGVTLRGAGMNATNLIGGETAYGFIELVGSTGVVVENLSMKVLSGSTQFGILGGRPSTPVADASSGMNRISNVLVYGSFTLAGVFMLNSEQCHYDRVTVRTLSGPAMVCARDLNGWAATAKYTHLSTTAGYAGGDGVVLMDNCSFLAYGTTATDIPLTVEYVQAFTAVSCYTLTTGGASGIVLSKGCYQASFVALQQEWNPAVGTTEPLGFWAKNVTIGAEVPSVRMGILGSTVYPVYGDDGVVFADFSFKSSRWRGTARTYQYDVDQSYSAEINFDPRATQISSEVPAPLYRARAAATETAIPAGPPLVLPIGATVTTGAPANRMIARLTPGTGVEVCRNKATNPTPATSTTGWNLSSYAGVGGTMTGANQTTGGPSAAAPSRWVQTWTVAPTSNSCWTGYGSSSTAYIPVTAGATVTVSIWGKVSWAGSNTTCRVLFYTSAPALVGSEVVGPSAAAPAGVWHRRFVTTVVPATATRMLVRFFSDLSTPIVGSTLEVSSLLAEAGSVLHNYFDGTTGSDPKLTQSWVGAAYASESIETAPASGYLQFWDGTTAWNLS